MPPRTTPKSYRPRVSDRTMVANRATHHTCQSSEAKGVVTITGMKLQGIGIRSLAAVARDPRRSTSERERCLGLGTECTKTSAAASGRRKMSLDIPFYRTSVCRGVMDGEAVPDFRGHFGSIDIDQRLPAMDVEVVHD